MNKKKLFIIFLIILCLILTISSVSASELNSNNGTGSFSDLSTLISNSNGTVSLDKNYTYNSSTDAEYINGITINKNLVINGNNHVISGNNQSAIFNFFAPSTVNDVLFTDVSNVSSKGVVIYADNTVISVNNCSFTKINANTNGVIEVKESSAYISNSKFYNNSIDAIVYSLYSDLIYINNCTFVNNTGKSFGAIYLFDSNFKIVNTTISNSSVNNENSYSTGGAVFIDMSLGVIIGCSIENNVISSKLAAGGAICNVNTLPVEIYNTTIVNNTITAKRAMGSGIFNKGILYLYNVTVVNNTLNSDNKITDAVYNINGVVSSDNLTVIENNTYTGTDEDVIYGVFAPIVTGNIFEGVEIEIPESFDLRNVNGTSYVTGIRNQQSSGSCWVFGNLAGLESFMLLTKNITYDFSENNMKNVMGKYGTLGWDYGPNDGGITYMALAYLLRWSGPINETDDPFNPSSKVSSEDLNRVLHVQDIAFIPQRMNLTDLNQIKLALMTYGALVISYHIPDNHPLNTYNSHYISPNHEVAIVGWDDSYSASHFGSDCPGDGAFIIKNSWGDYAGDKGYYYVSYYDETFTNMFYEEFSAVAYVNVEDTDYYIDNYQYDPLGNTFYSLGFNNETAWMMNQFTANNSNPLAAFGLYTYSANSVYEAYIYVNDKLVHTQNGTIINSGYNTIKLSEIIPLNEGDIFKVAIKLTTPNNLCPIAIETNIKGSTSKATAEANQSFISRDGKNWIDISEDKNIFGISDVCFYAKLTNTNVCLKAYTFSESYLNSFTELAKLINSSGSTVTLDKNYTYISAYDSEYTNGIVLNKDLTINGNGFTLNGTNVARIFNISSDATIVLNNISFVDGSSNYGGLIYNDGDLTINNSNFTNKGNSTSRYIYSNNSVVITNSTFNVIVKLADSAGDISVGENKTILVTVNDGCIISSKANKNVVLNFNSLQFSGTTDSEGKVNITASNLAYGDYTVNVGNISSGTNVFIGNDTLTFKVRRYDPQMNVTIIQNYEIINFTVELPADATGNMTIKYNDTSNVYKIHGGVNIFNITLFSGGVYNFTLFYSGDVKYLNQTNKTTITFNKVTFKSSAVEKYFGNDSKLIITLLLNDARFTNQNVTLNINNQLKNVTTDSNGQIFVDKNEVGFYDVIAIYKGTYGFTSIHTNLTVLSTILANNLTMDYKDGSKFNATLLNTDGSLSINKTHLFNLNGENNWLDTDSNGVAHLLISNNAGNYSLIVTNLVSGESKEFEVIVNKISPEISVKVNNTTYPNNVTISSSLAEFATGNVTYKLNNGQNITLAVGDKWVISSLAAGNYTVIAIYDGDINYYKSSVSLNFTVSKASSFMSISVRNVVYGNNSVVYVNVTDFDGKPLSGYIVYNKTKSVVLVDGKAVINLGVLASGSYDMDISYSGNTNYTSDNGSASFNVSKANSTVIVSAAPILLGENATVKVSVYGNNNPLTGNVTVIINNISKTAVLLDGNASVEFNGLTETKYEVFVSYNGNENFTISSNSTELIIIYPVKLEAPNVEMYYKNGSGVVVYLFFDNKPLAGETVIININNVDYSVTTDKNGKALFKLGLAAGNYVVSSYYNGSYGFTNTTSYVTVLPTIKGEELTLFYRNGSAYTVKVVDGQGNSVANQRVGLNVNGILYDVVTSFNGVASLPIGLSAGKYIITAYNYANGESTSNNITVLSRLSSNELELYYKNGSAYTVKVVDGQGNPSINHKLTTNVNGVFYDIVTDNKGVASLPIGLNPGKYVITVQDLQTGEMTSNNITVKPILVENQDLELFYKNGSAYTVKALDGQGKPAKGVSVTFNINGVFYDAVTDLNGIASLPIGLNAGSYIITAQYKGFMVSNTITVKPILIGQDITLRYRDGNNYTVQALDGQGKPAVNVTVSLNVNGVLYNVVTDNKGIASLPIGLGVGEYIITAAYNGFMTSNTITVLSI